MSQVMTAEQAKAVATQALETLVSGYPGMCAELDGSPAQIWLEVARSIGGVLADNGQGSHPGVVCSLIEAVEQLADQRIPERMIDSPQLREAGEKFVATSLGKTAEFLADGGNRDEAFTIALRASEQVPIHILRIALAAMLAAS